MAGVGRGSTSTRTCRSAPRISSTRSPTRRTRAITSSTPGRRPTWSTRRGRLEASILLINTPECLISEGLADLGVELRRPARASVEDLLVELFERAGLPVAGDPATRPRGRRAIGGARRRAARPRRPSAATPRSCATPTAARRRGPRLPARRRRVSRRPSAAKRLEFIEHPLWRTYVFVYAEGEALLRRWVEAVPPEERAARFGRLLHEQLTPASILAATPTTSRRRPRRRATSSSRGRDRPASQAIRNPAVAPRQDRQRSRCRGSAPRPTRQRLDAPSRPAGIELAGGRARRASGRHAGGRSDR